MPPKRMTANPVRPARHRAGKPTGGPSSSSSASASDSEADERAPAPPSVVPPPPKATTASRISGRLGGIDLDARRREVDAEEERRRRQTARLEAERLAHEQGFVTEEESGPGPDEDDASSEASSDEESEEEEAPRRLMIRPRFVPKSQRRALAAKEEAAEAAALEADQEARRQAADALVEEQIKKQLAARAAGKKHWDDEEASQSEVDTTDGIDPEAEEAAWRVRELKRLRRGRAAIEEREAALAEVERRRQLTAEERAAEDEDHLAQQRREREGRGKMAYMQKYYHRGAFFQEEAEAAGLRQRDIMGSRIQDEVRDREALPVYLRRRDMTKLGRKGASKYSDLRTEDTGRWGELDDGPSAAAGRGRGPDEGGFRADAQTGANAVPVKRRGGGSPRPDADKRSRAEDG